MNFEFIVGWIDSDSIFILITKIGTFFFTRCSFNCKASGKEAISSFPYEQKRLFLLTHDFIQETEHLCYAFINFNWSRKAKDGIGKSKAAVSQEVWHHQYFNHDDMRVWYYKIWKCKMTRPNEIVKNGFTINCATYKYITLAIFMFASLFYRLYLNLWKVSRSRIRWTHDCV